MKRLLSVLCLFAMWVAPANGEPFTGFNQGLAYNIGWNLQWAGNCLVSGTVDTISKLQFRALEVLKGKELSDYEFGVRGRYGNSVNCFKERIEGVIAKTKWFLNSRDRASNFPRLL